MKERFYHIDSRHKYNTGSTTNPMTWRFPDTLRNLHSVQVIEAVVPNTMHTVTADNKLTFNYQLFNAVTNTLDTANFKIEVIVPAGAYSQTSLATALTNEILRQILLVNATRAALGQTQITDTIYVHVPGHTGFASLVVVPNQTLTPGQATFVASECSAFYNIVSPTTPDIQYSTISGSFKQSRVTRSTQIIHLMQPTAVFLSIDEMKDAIGTIEVSPEAPLGNRKGIVARLQNPGERFELTHKYDHSNRSVPVVSFSRSDVALSQLTLSWVDVDGKTIDLHGAHWSVYMRIVSKF